MTHLKLMHLNHILFKTTRKPGCPILYSLLKHSNVNTIYTCLLIPPDSLCALIRLIHLMRLIHLIISPGSLSDLITMLRHNMAAISKIGEFRIHLALFAICSVLLGLSTQSSSRSGQERKDPCVLARWRSKTNDNDVKCYWKDGTAREIYT